MSTHLTTLEAMSGGPLDVTSAALVGTLAIQLTPATGYVQLAPPAVAELAETLTKWLRSRFACPGGDRNGRCDWVIYGDLDCDVCGNKGYVLPGEVPS